MGPLLVSDASASVAGTITATQGRVDLLKPGEFRASPVKLGQEVEIGDVVRTKADSKTEITFVDNSIMRLAPKTRLKIEEYLFDGQNRESGVIKLFRGKARAIVSKPKGRAKIGKFQIHTPTAVIGVRGTDFYVFHMMSLSGVLVTLGSVEVFNPEFPNNVEYISPGTLTIVKSGSPPQTRAASEAEMNQHENDTYIAGDDGDGDGGDGGSGDGDDGTGGLGDPLNDPPADDPPADDPPADDPPADDPPINDPPPPNDPPPGDPNTVDIPYTDNVVLDSTPPNLTLNSYPNVVTTVTDASFTMTVTDDSATTLTYTLDGAPVASPDFTGLGEGHHQFRATATDSAGNSTTATYSWMVGALDATLSGSATGTGSSFTSTAMDSTVVSVSGEPWGAWVMNISGDYTGPSNSAWTITAGGVGYAPGDIFEGYWIDRMNGTYSGALMNGASNLFYLTETTLGVGAGAVDGSYDAGLGTFEATVLGYGTYVEVPLLFGASIDGDYGGLIAPGVFDGDVDSMSAGLMGGTTSLWSGSPEAALLMGEAINTNGAVGYVNHIRGSGEGGEFSGGSVGLYDSAGNDRIIGSAAMLYIRPGGEAGVITSSDIDGVAFPDIGMWEATGSFTATQKNTISVAPAGLDASIYNTYTNSGVLSASFNGSGNIFGEVLLETNSIVDYVNNTAELWGTFSPWMLNEVAGTYTAGAGSLWSGQMGGYDPVGAYYDTNINAFADDFGYWLTDVTAGEWSGGLLTAGMDGSFMTPTKMGVMSGDLYGEYDAVLGEWGTIGVGTWEGEPLAFFNHMGPRLHVTATAGSAYYEYTNGDVYWYEYALDGSYGQTKYKYNGGGQLRTTYFADGTTIIYDSINDTLSHGTWNTAGGMQPYLAGTVPGGFVYSDSGTGYIENFAAGGYLDLFIGGVDSLWGGAPVGASVLGGYDTG
ncbi:MAG: FecR domain-containing protein, partial [Thermodesulfobacteriota bacterium]